MGYLLVLLGFAVSLSTALLEKTDFKGFCYFAIMMLFFAFMLGIVFLSYAKMAISKAESVKNNKILSWQLEEKRCDDKAWRVYLILTAVALIIGAMLIAFAQTKPLSALLLTVAAALELIGWYSAAQARINKVYSTMPDFVLAHNGIMLLGKITILDGKNNAVFSTELKQNTLYLGIKKRTNKFILNIPVPAQEKENTAAFIEDLNAFFEEQNNAQ